MSGENLRILMYHSRAWTHRTTVQYFPLWVWYI